MVCHSCGADEKTMAECDCKSSALARRRMATRAQDKPTRAQLEAEHAVAMDALKAISMTAGRQSKELRIARRALHEIQHARISGQLPEVTKRSGV